MKRSLLSGFAHCFPRTRPFTDKRRTNDGRLAAAKIKMYENFNNNRQQKSIVVFAQPLFTSLSSRKNRKRRRLLAVKRKTTQRRVSRTQIPATWEHFLTLLRHAFLTRQMVVTPPPPQLCMVGRGGGSESGFGTRTYFITAHYLPPTEVLILGFSFTDRALC